MSALGYKNLKVLENIVKRAWHPNLIGILTWLQVRYANSSLVITSAARDEKIHHGDSGIHMTDPLRAFDLRSRTFEAPYMVVGDLNSHWIYDPHRPDLHCAMYHNTGNGNHIHIQAHDNTVRQVEVYPTPA